MKWISVNDWLPEIAGFLQSDDILFVCDDGKVYCGQYHLNGCFYAPKIAAHTPQALRHRSKNELPKAIVLFWGQLPEPPAGITPAAPDRADRCTHCGESPCLGEFDAGDL